MLEFLEQQYVDNISFKLERYKVVEHSPFRANFRCPYCGDSAKSKFKARGWFLESERSVRYYCHNCGRARNFYQFLKDQDFPLYSSYTAEKYLNKRENREKTREMIKTITTPKPVFADKGHLSKLTRISDLDEDHPARVYVEKAREIPNFEDIWYAPNYGKWINTIIHDKLKVMKTDPRVVFPFRDEDKKLFGVSGRAIYDSNLRYITIMFDENKEKIFGLDRVDFSKKYYIFEGQIDSYFIKNSLAMAGADGGKSLKNLENSVLVFDCEFRNREMLKRIDKAIAAGRKVCIWPKTMQTKGKDINDFILSGMSEKEIVKIIDENTYTGLMAKAVLSDRRARN